MLFKYIGSKRNKPNVFQVILFIEVFFMVSKYNEINNYFSGLINSINNFANIFSLWM